MRPVNPNVTMLLANSAAVAGFDGGGILNHRGKFMSTNLPRTVYADPKKPVLVINRGTKPATPEEKEIIEKDAEDFFSGSFFKALQNTRARTD
jgi:hypothetical protein